jgi:hypothetical protein
MRRLFLLFILVASVCNACDTTSSAAPTPTTVPLPVLVVDKVHMTTPGLVYEIPAGNGFILDASGYDFGSSTPMAVQVVMGNSSYQVEWTENASRQSVSVSGLKPLFNAQPLTTFVAGQQLIVSIGKLNMQGRFKPLWVGVVNVK